MMQAKTWRFSGLLLAVLVVVGCSTTDEATEPAPLVEFAEEVRLDKLWSIKIGNGQGKAYNRITPLLSGDELIAAAADGTVAVIDYRKGKVIWKVETERPLVGGVGANDELVLLGAESGHLMALDRKTAKLRWQTQLTGEILAPPHANDRYVVAQTYDGKVFALDAKTGKELWRHTTLVPRLTLRGTGTPFIYGPRVLAGFANGRVAALDLETGTPLWEQRLSIPKGSTEIARLSDVDGEILIVNDLLYAVGYQGRIAAIDIASGNRVWDRDASSYVGLALGYDNIYVAGSDGTVTAHKMTGESVGWTQTALARRKLSDPTAFRRVVAVGDHEGYLHLLSQVDGRMVGRLHVDGDGLRVVSRTWRDQIYVFTNGGKLIAYKLLPVQAKQSRGFLGMGGNKAEPKRKAQQSEAQKSAVEAYQTPEWQEFLRRNEAEEARERN